MPFRETCVLDERVEFAETYLRGDIAMAALCRMYGVSRKTGYETVARYRSGGVAGLVPRSHAPHHVRHGVSDEVRAAVIGLRRDHPSWGPKKLKARLSVLHPGRVWPAASTIGEIIAGEGLARRRRRLPYLAARTRPLAHAVHPNDVWCIDLKGWFVTGDGKRCEPLTLADAASRYLLRCTAQERHDCASVWPLVEAAFHEHGLPLSMRSDNGPPFGCTGAGRLSPLCVRLVKAGVLPDHIDAGKPQQNGRLERLHRTLKEDVANPPARSARAQAERLRTFQRIYNEERPHEALEMQVPAACYQPSPRQWCGRLVSPDYEDAIQVRKVRHNGQIKWRGDMVYISATLAGEPVGLEEQDNGIWTVNYGPVHLGHIDPKNRFTKPRQMRKCVTHHAG